jgi:biopolymer transport protein ExbD
MKFFTSKRRQAPTIIIISLIDILIVLLIFMMVTTTFKDQPAIKLTLPESTEAKLAAQTKANPNETAVLVTIAKQAPFLYLGTQPVTPEQLKTELVQRVARNPQLTLAIRADTDAPFGQIVKVMDIAKAAKIKTAVSALAKPNDSR